MTMPLILIAEDDLNIRSLLRLTLDTGHFEIIEAEDGVSAIETARRRQPDLMFLDWRMPLRSGLEVCKALRADPETQELDREAALAAGVDDFITKPFSPIALLDKVREVLGADALL
jgi:DNA-binding response OmpR family regulator